MNLLTQIKACVFKAAPTEPVVPCLHCHEDFVWWLHPVQLCDGCVERELATLVQRDDCGGQELATPVQRCDEYATLKLAEEP